MAKTKSSEVSFEPAGTFPSQMECPKCGAKLRQGSIGSEYQSYACPKCGYMGQVGLEPGIIKLDKRKKL